MVARYDVLAARDDDSGLFLAEVPHLPGCFSQGETEDAALANAREAIALHVQALREVGQDFPGPSTHVLRAVDVATA